MDLKVNKTLRMYQKDGVLSQENEIRSIYTGNDVAGRDRLIGSIEILSGGINARLSQEIDSLFDTMQTQNNRAISSTVNGRVLPEIPNIK